MTTQQEQEIQTDHDEIENAALYRALRAALRREPSPREINRARAAYSEASKAI